MLTALAALIVSYVALYLTVLKPGDGLIEPWMDDIEFHGGGSSRDGLPTDFMLRVYLRIHNAGSGGVALSEISPRCHVEGLPELTANAANLQVDCQYTHGLTRLAPYQTEVGSLDVRFDHSEPRILDGRREDVLRLLSHVTVRLDLKYRVYGKSRIARRQTSFDLTHMARKALTGGFTGGR